MKICVSRSAALAATMLSLACVSAGYCAVTAFSIRLAFGFSRDLGGLAVGFWLAYYGAHSIKLISKFATRNEKL